MSRTVRAKRPWHVVSRGFGVDGFVAIGSGDPTVPVGARVTWFDTEEDARQHPAAAAYLAKMEMSASLAEIDAEAALSIDKNHLAKAHEAERVIFDEVWDLDRLPYIRAEIERRGDDMSAQDIAVMWWTKHAEDAAPEAERTKAKRIARGEQENDT